MDKEQLKAAVDAGFDSFRDYNDVDLGLEALDMVATAPDGKDGITP